MDATDVTDNGLSVFQNPKLSSLWQTEKPHLPLVYYGFEVFAVISEMTLGIIEPYNCGYLEIIPEGDGSDYWLIAGVHINGEAYRPSPRLYRSERLALTKAQKIYDWIVNHENQIQGWGCWCSDLNITLWHQSKEYPSCPLD